MSQKLFASSVGAALISNRLYSYFFEWLKPTSGGKMEKILGTAEVCEASVMDHPVLKLALCRTLRGPLEDGDRAHLLFTSILTPTEAGGHYMPSHRHR